MQLIHYLSLLPSLYADPKPHYTDAKQRRGRQRKVWSRIVDNLFGSLDVDKAEWLDEIEKGDSAFLAMVEESIGERESKKFVEGLNSKVNYTL